MKLIKSSVNGTLYADHGSRQSMLSIVKSKKKERKKGICRFLYNTITSLNCSNRIGNLFVITCANAFVKSI